MDRINDEDVHGWEIVREEDLVERSDDESVEIINGYSSKEEESSAEDDDECESPDHLGLGNCITPVQTGGQLVLLQDELTGSSATVSFQDVVETVVVVIAISSMGLAVTSAVMNREDVVARQIQKFHLDNMDLREQINYLKKVIQDLKSLQIPKYKPEEGELMGFKTSAEDPLQPSHPFSNQVRNDYNEKIHVEEHASRMDTEDKVNMENFTQGNSFESPLPNIADDFISRGELFKHSIKTDIDLLNNQVAQSILKTSLSIKNILYEKICLLGPYFVLSEEDCKKHLPDLINKEPVILQNISQLVEISNNISAIINGVAKEVAFSWMELYVNLFENRLNKISNDINQNINVNNEIMTNILNHVTSKNNSQYVTLNEKHHCKKMCSRIKQKKRETDKTYNKKAENFDKQHKNKKEKTEKNGKYKKVRQPQDKKKLKKQNNKFEHKNLKKQPHHHKHKKENDDNYKGKFYFDKTKWKFVTKGGKINKNTMHKRKEKHCCGIGNCSFKYGCSINMTFDNMKPEKNWYIDMGNHRSSKRFEESRIEWVFDRAKGRRFMKS
ncbi:uncharacterized protein LOC106663943 [Cimex lectularius]|uniref:Uncharacterized protein n=1 Tax=Cimex lectularius TaxID=79782 RepID=A0A8I6RJY6_CIMLE|nr:uncharacterized protein LOC106663943 [Cimex lectularius]